MENENTYPWNPADYAAHSSEQYEWAQELIGKLNLTGTESLLDIGCGDGKVTAAIARCLPLGSVVGIDSSKDMIAFAEQSFPPALYQNLAFLIMDATQLIFNNHFDVIFSNATLHWVKDHLAVLQGVKRSLKKPGKLLFQMAGFGNAHELIAVLNTFLTNDRWQPYFRDFRFPYRFYDPDDYQMWLGQVGLQAQRIELIPKDMKHRGLEGLAGWIRTAWLPYTTRIPPDLREIFITEVSEAYLQWNPLDDQGYTHVKMVRLEVEAINS